MCIKVLNIFFNFFIIQTECFNLKKDYLFKFEAAIFITKTEGVIYTKVK